MHLKQLQMSGFKSFPEKLLLSFGKGITACVGPNGSGKSNVADAVRWVLGEQAASVLRIKTMEDIIWGGTSTRKAMGMAEVIMTFDNTDRRLHLDSDEVAVCRRYYRSGASEYRLNGQQVRLKDVNELFMDTGLGRDGYSIVGQGRIADIVDARSGDRRTIFEEASGISKYRYRKLEAERNFEKAEENLIHLDVILSGLEERVGPLEKEAEKAKKYLALWEEKKRAEVGLWLSSLEGGTASLRDLSYKITLAETQRNDASDEIDKLDAEAEGLAAKGNSLLSEKDSALRGAAGMEERAAGLDGQAAVAENDAAHKDADVARVITEMEQAELGRTEISRRIEEKNADKESINEDISKIETEIDHLKTELSGVTLDEGGAGDELSGLTARQSALTGELAEARVSLSRASSQLEEARDRGGRADEAIAALELQMAEARGEEQASNSAAADAEEKIAGLLNSYNGYKLRLDKILAKLEDAAGKSENLKREAEDKRRRAKIIEDLEKNLEGYGYSVKKVVQRAEEGALRVHGPVSRLVEAPDEYATAVETALGGAAQHIVVDSDEDAKRAISLLRKENAGRATFLPISVIKPQELSERGLEAMDGYIGIAAELVDYDKKYDGIIRNLLGKVAVAEDIDRAVEIAKKFGYRFRVVTLDGQVVNAGGSMTGGAAVKTSGLLSRRKDLEELRAEAQRLEDEAKAAEGVRRETQGKADECRAALLGAEGEMATAREDRLSFLTDARLHAQQAGQLAAQIEGLKAEKENSAGRIAGLEAEKDKITSEIEQTEAGLAGLEAEIGQKSAALEKLAAERARLAEAIGEAGLKRLARQKDAEAADAQIEELRRQLTADEGRGTERGQMLTDLRAQAEELRARAAELYAQSKELREQANTSRTGVADIEKERNELERQIVELRKSSREALERREGFARELVRLEGRREQLQKEYDGIIMKLQEEYNLTRREAAENYEPAKDIKQANKSVNELRNKIRALGPVNQGAIEEYAEVSEKYITYKTQMDDVRKSRAELQKLIDDLTANMKQAFTKSFSEISGHFAKIFPELYGGGGAELFLEDPDDCLNCGIGMTITQPGKAPQAGIEGFSGGEKAIIAVSIYFAIMKVNPAPFCVLDEIDSALDENNVVNIANYIARMSRPSAKRQGTQYVVITHRRGTMEAANMLYGVLKRDGESRMIALNMDEIEEKVGMLE